MKYPNGYKNIDSGFNRLFVVYKQGAKNRKLSFNLTVEQFRKLTSSVCFYCGQPPSKISKIARSRKQYIYNGIDRKDNILGYTIENSIPCCEMCNKMKNIYNIEMFLHKVMVIARRHGA